MEKQLIKRNDIKGKDRAIFLAIIFLPVLLVFRDMDNDIWFLLNSGRYVVQQGIPVIEPFTLHQGFAFVMQQWLSAIIFWGAYSVLGALGVKLVVVACYVLMVIILYKLCMKVSDGYFFVSAIIVFCVSVLLGIWLTSRPSIFSNLILLIEVYLLESYILSKKKVYLYFLPLLSVLLINLHAAMWPMLFVFLGPYFIDAFGFKVGRISGQGYPKATLFIVAGVMLLAGFVNPYGWDAMTYLFRSYGYVEISYLVSEMMPPRVDDVAGAVAFFSIFLVVMGYLLYRKGTTRLRYVLLTLGTVYMALSSMRSFLFFAVCASFPLAWYLKDMHISLPEKEETKREGILKKVLLGLIIGAVVFGVVYHPTEEVERISSWTNLGEAIDFIKAEERTDPIVLYTGYNDGGYAEFEGLAPYMDQRAEVFVMKNNKKEDVMKEYYDLQAGRLFYKDFVDKYRFTHLIVTEIDSLYVNLENDSDYTLAFINDEYTVFERNN